LPSFTRDSKRSVSPRLERGQILIEAVMLLLFLSAFFALILSVAQHQKQNLKKHRFSGVIYAKKLA
jgi:hypothetical protein